MHVKCLAQYVAESKCSLLRSAIIISSGEVGKGGGWMLLTPISLTSSGVRSQPYGLLRTLFSKPQFPHLKNLIRSQFRPLEPSSLEGGLLSGVFFLYLSTSFPTGPSGLMVSAAWGEEQEPLICILQMQAEAECRGRCQSQQEGTGWSHKPGPANSVP